MEPSKKPADEIAEDLMTVASGNSEELNQMLSDKNYQAVSSTLYAKTSILNVPIEEVRYDPFDTILKSKFRL